MARRRRVNHPGGSGPNGWEFKLGDRFVVTDVDANDRQELLVSSPNGGWLGLTQGLRRRFGGDVDRGGLGRAHRRRPWRAPRRRNPERGRSPAAADSANVRLHGSDADAGSHLPGQHRPAVHRDDPSRLRPGGRERRPVHRDQRLRRHSRAHGDDRGVFRRRRADAGLHVDPARAPHDERPGRPSIRPAVHPDGTVYAVFSSWQTFSNATNIGTADVVVVRDDDWGRSGNPFSALVDPGDNVAGMRVITGMGFTFSSWPARNATRARSRSRSTLVTATSSGSRGET